MKGERKLSLVKPPPPATSDGLGPDAAQRPAVGPARRPASADLDLPEGEPAVTDEELREAEALRKALDRGDDPFASALRAAASPAPASARDLDAILARAMGDLDAPPTAIEEHEADRLRLALEEHDAQRAGRLAVGPGRRAASGDRDEGTAPLAVALRAAWAPSPIGVAKNDALVGRTLTPQAVAGSGAGAHPAPAARAPIAEDAPAPVSLRRFRLGPRAVATMSAVVAMAAGVFLFVRQMGHQEAPPPSAAVAAAPSAASSAHAVAAIQPAPRIAARSTTDLFDATTPFPRSGGESARVDRIAGARAADLRANRFAAWGVR